MAHRQPIESVYPLTSECTPQDLEAGEWWALFPLQKANRSPMLSFRALSSRMNPSHFCQEFRSFDAFRLLCKSPEGINIEPLTVPPETPQGQNRLERLPPEILGLIFEFSQPGDSVALGLCSRPLWKTLSKWVQNEHLIWTNTYSLAGTPIIYASSLLKTLPPCLYPKYPNTVPEETRDEEVLDSQKRVVTPATAWLDNILLQSYQAPLPNHDSYTKSFDRTITMANIPDHLHENMRSCLPTLTIKRGSKWLLRNLTNNEYIRMESVVTEEGEETVSHVGNKWLTLDILLLWLITWRGDQANPWSWEELERYVGKTVDDMMYSLIGFFNHRPVTDEFWPIWTGNWAGHSLEVVTDREMDEVWIDRTDEIERLSQKMLRMMYILSRQNGTPKTKRHWEWAISTRGYVTDEEWKFKNPDGVTFSYQTHKTIYAGPMKRHAEWLCNCDWRK
ncbi:hypothetical protein FLAG1_09389 [Fusarium langsethiae]|uniref:F-box domain-containing protein n=1 Tax=Fusarium langsethiae TaxID=179993 RepID=A0A0M9EQH6_FUSLA|nr:hypothetical protein FLAG1_09389 [Fusarium langsethiae]GKU22178.1 unnamed protein product [Fusarium langsethiae]